MQAPRYVETPAAEFQMRRCCLLLLWLARPSENGLCRNSRSASRLCVGCCVGAAKRENGCQRLHPTLSCTCRKITHPQPLLNDSLICHGGEPVALIVAKSRPALADALEAVNVRIEEAEPPQGIAFCRRLGDRAAVAGRFAQARHRTVAKVSIPRMTASDLEPRGGIASAHPFKVSR